MEEANVLVEDDLELLEQAECLHRGAHLDQVVVRVGAPDVDLLVEAAVAQRLDVIRDVLTEITRFAVRSNKDPALLFVDRLAGRGSRWSGRTCRTACPYPRRSTRGRPSRTRTRAPTRARLRAVRLAHSRR